MEQKKQTTIYSFSTTFFMLAQWVISVALVRLGGFSDAGIFSLAMSIANMFGTFSYYGLRGFQVSDVSHEYTQKQYFISRIITTIISFPAFYLYALFSRTYSEKELWAILLYLVYVNTNSFCDVLFGALQTRGRLYVNAYSFCIKGVLCGTSMLAVYAWKQDLLLALAVMDAADIAVAVIYDLRCYFREGKFEFWPTREDIRKVAGTLKDGFPLMVASLLPMIITAIPRQTIHDMCGNTELGYFSSLFTPTVIIATLMPAVVLSFLPRMAQDHQSGDRRDFIKVIGNCYVSIVAFTLLVEAVAAVFGRPAIRLVFGEDILEYYPLFYWAILASGLNAMGACGECALIGMHKTNLPMYITGTALALLCLVTSPLVAKMGIMGAAFALIIAYGLRMVLQIAAIGNYLVKDFSQ